MSKADTLVSACRCAGSGTGLEGGREGTWLPPTSGVTRGAGTEGKLFVCFDLVRGISQKPETVLGVVPQKHLHSSGTEARWLVPALPAMESGRRGTETLLPMD